MQPRLQKVEKFVDEFGMMIDTKFAEVYSVSADFFSFLYKYLCRSLDVKLVCFDIALWDTGV